ncbi:hypothetical protein [Amycolatopsis sp. 195334CR]|uniref:hypothetical protein n=1 Tax=Amycolatopsis sp. 195334CR TaxID=2814588 RepID=UPI001A8C48AA|nr:hypothetical protein [Amycolatopsis sp. 195334CR]MBN6037750.1 hypothetical protein [Amycolatopsis sp. 195334CR]
MKKGQVERLLSYSLSPNVRERLAGLLSEIGTLAGWQALDMGRRHAAWLHYESALAAARESGHSGFIAHAAAEQAFVLLDLGEASAAVNLLTELNNRAKRDVNELLRSWLCAALGEAFAAVGDRVCSSREFDRAFALLPDSPGDFDEPYVALDVGHLSRWQGHAFTRVGDPGAVEVLSVALEQLDPSFTRAEISLRVDLATAFTAIDEHEQARLHYERAMAMAGQIGSVRQAARIRSLVGA